MQSHSLNKFHRPVKSTEEVYRTFCQSLLMLPTDYNRHIPQCFSFCQH